MEESKNDWKFLHHPTQEITQNKPLPSHTLQQHTHTPLPTQDLKNILTCEKTKDYENL